MLEQLPSGMPGWFAPIPKDVVRDLVKRILRHLDHLRDTQNEEIYGHACAALHEGMVRKTCCFFYLFLVADV